MKLKTKEKIYLLIFSIFLFLILFSIFCYYPLIKGFVDEAKELKKIESQLSFLDQKISQLKKAKAIEKEIKGNIQSFKSLFIQKEMPLDFINFLEATAKDCKVELELSRFSEISLKEEERESLLFEGKTKGDFVSTLCFLNKVENAPFLVEFNSVNLFKEKDQNEISSSFSLKVFVK